MPKGVEVQVLSSAQETEKNPRILPGIFDSFLNQTLKVFTLEFLGSNTQGAKVKEFV